MSFNPKMLLLAGTLIHGTSFNRDVLKSISETGIITGQFFGIDEDGETYYCTDFHRLDENMTLKTYNDSFSYRDGRCPFKNLGKNSIAFILMSDERASGLLKYDCYKDEIPESDVTKEFVKLNGLPDIPKEKLSSILFGVPSCFINGIVVGDKQIILDNVLYLKNLFPGCFIVRNNGHVLCNPDDDKITIEDQVEKCIDCIKQENEVKMQLPTLDVSPRKTWLSKWLEELLKNHKKGRNK